MKRPYGLGLNGHARKCTCTDCCAARAKDIKARWREHGAVDRPTSDKTIFVRSYWREGNQRAENRRAILKLFRRAS